ncbi:thrombospondin type 3 repeat-containing protein [Vibrio sp. 99-70-13A1]|uniref:thrombospondin type 3 repeat-containing protein n=1 Tax=Vibrio sp. 99-70-13A1 TaxID=2607601 RepID=UPI001493B168|nr:thrombospondin type 3 repeat-containing protein [Vibrio sp. 99-70-13A1]NOH95792.1 hypothetical protein [Vibrio sp. 99-70-13A1]
MDKKVLALVISTFFMSACSDSGGTSTIASQGSVMEVKAIDGYLKGAVVWLDTTPNFIWDEGEPKADSGDGGVAELDVSGIDNYESYSVVVKAVKGVTIDLDNPDKTISYDFVMTAPAGETNITPLSTLVKLDMDTTGASKEEALSDVSEKLNISEEDILSDYTASEIVANKAKNLVACGLMPETTEKAMSTFSETGYFDTNSELTEVSSVVKELKANETVITDGNDFIPVENDGDGDTDNDGFDDENDMFPLNSSEHIDSDEDGVGDNADAFKDDPTEQYDTDKDGVGDNADAFKNDPTEQYDTDEDGVGDNADAFKDDPTEQYDTDEDGVGDNTDVFKYDPTEQYDTDEDGVGDNADAFKDDPTEQYDTDEDGVGDNTDAFIDDPTEQYDNDEDGNGDNKDPDDDNDLVLDADDNCPYLSNENQLDSNGNGIGDACDSERLATFDSAIFDTDKWL